ncbi:hypothetical protein VTO73DRAFT_5228 [Trametes versicolor]
MASSTPTSPPAWPAPTLWYLSMPSALPIRAGPSRSSRATKRRRTTSEKKLGQWEQNTSSSARGGRETYR